MYISLCQKPNDLLSKALPSEKVLLVNNKEVMKALEGGCLVPPSGNYIDKIGFQHVVSTNTWFRMYALLHVLVNDFPYEVAISMKF